MQDKIIKNLTKYGLTNIEARIYMAILALESASVDKISKQAEVNRTSCYPVLERLKDQGLVGQVKKKGRTEFKASAPEKFYDLLDTKKESIEKIIPDLKSLFEISRGKPDVRFYEGEEGLKTVLNSILEEADELLVFGEGDSFLNAIPGWTDNYVEKRGGKSIKVKIILKASPAAVKAIQKRRSTDNKVSRNTKVRMLPEAYKIDCSSFDIYNNKIVLYSFKKPTNAVVIESRTISQLMRTVFGILWDLAEKYDHLFK